MIESASPRRFSNPSSAFTVRARSTLNGVETIPTTIAPSSLAIFETTGAAPVPVPPPIPAVTNTRSASPRTSLIVPCAISVARSPILGSPPAPRPLVSDLPTRILVSASIILRCCLSVLIATVSAPLTPRLYSRLTVLFPAPPAPTMTIRGSPKSSSSSILSLRLRFSASAFSNASCTISCILTPSPSWGYGRWSLRPRHRVH